MAREMKDSGIEWIGKVPTDWHYIKLKTFYNFEKGKNAQRYTIDYIGQNEGTIPVYSGQTENNGIMGFVKDCDYEVSECLFTTTVGAKVMTPRILSGKFCLSQNCLIMKQIKTCNNHFFYYSLLPLFDNEKASIPSYMQPSLRINDLNKYGFFVPSLDTQNNIASFLDSKCAKIDKAIDATKASIEEYKKLRQAIITETVTKGLDPDVEMKDSGIEWIGVIPKHWSLMKMKYLVEFVQDKAQEQDSSKQYIALENIESWTGKYIETENTYGTEGALLCNKDDVIFGKLRPYLAKTMLINENSVCSSEFAVMKGNGLIPRFLNYLARSDHFISVVNAGAYGTKMPRANIDQIGNLYFPAPLVSEQEMVSSFLDTKCSEIDSLIKSKEKLIEELTAYRKSLIYEYITGKKEVPAV